MSRAKLPDRRPSMTQKVYVALDGGKQVKLLVTIGFNSLGRPMEVFTADFKAGTAMHTIVMDACVMMSRLLQHGDTPLELYKALARPESVLGAIAKAIAEL